MTINTGDRIFNRVPAHYYRNKTGEVKEVTKTEIVVEYNLNKTTTKINIRHNIFDLKYFEIVEVG